MTKEEAAWVKKLQKLLLECPSDRIGAFTVGDSYIGLYDRSRENEINQEIDSGSVEFGAAVNNIGASLGSLNFPFQIHSTAG